MSRPVGLPVRATYRLQLHRGFTFRDATRIVPYLAALGISHLYASPITEARPGSTHGYDIVDHNRVNPELGGEAGFGELAAALAAHGIGLVLDIVPNHMGVGGRDNAWWLDVLEWGRESPFAGYFDINWDPGRPDLKGRVLLPVLADHYGRVLEQGEIELRFDAAEGSFSAWYYEHRFPIAPRSYPTILAAGGAALEEIAAGFAADGRVRDRALLLKCRLAAAAGDAGVAAGIAAAVEHFRGTQGRPASFRPLHRLLEAQSYRIACWRVAADEINYRRFFNINELAGLRMELPELFEATHRLVLRLAGEGAVDGLRVDHIDGLFDPRAYCEALAQRLPPDFYLVVEKILARYETLPDWPVAGTTGYDFLNQVLAIFVDPAGEEAMTRLYHRLTGRETSFDDVLYAAKKRIMQVNLASEINVLAHEFHGLAMRDWRTRDFTLFGLRAALEEVIAAFPVYRTYVSAQGVSADDRRYIDWAVALARKRWRIADHSVFDFLHAVLRGESPQRDDGVALHTAMHFQQATGPVMAKAAEDTAFYRYFRLLALNEVGGDPRRFGMSVAAFHHLTLERARTWPRAMLTTATHDTKRGEDARMRLALLSEMPREWGRRVVSWLRFNRSRRSEIDGEIVPDRNAEYLFYQALLGAWPAALASDNRDGVAELAERLAAFMTKAVREGKEQSSWSNPHAAYEAALQRFVGAVLDVSRPNPFVADFHAFLETLARPAAIASLSQLVLKLTAPGVPDIYQGGELFDFSLVDPDNRRPVDFARREALLSEIAEATPAALAAGWRDGREKLFATQRLLALRRSHPELFAEGDYRPLEVDGTHAAHLCAFARTRGAECLVVAVPRLVHRLYRDGDADWGSTSIVLPGPAAWRDVLGSRRIEARDRVAAADLLAGFPVAVLLGGPDACGGSAG